MANTTTTHVPHPYVHISATPGIQVPRGNALSRIQTYLEQSKTSPHLHPDTLFTESGLTYAGSASTGGVILHQLRRVEQGLQGVWLGIDPEADEALGKLDDVKTELDGVVPDEAPGDYQQQLREQGEGDVVGEVDKRNNAVTNVDSTIPAIATHGKKRAHEEMNGDGEVEAVAETPVKDKEARKKAKKERRKAEKRDRHAQAETPTNKAQPSQINESSQLNGHSEESQVQVESSQPNANGTSSQLDNVDEVSPSKRRVQLSASPDQYSSGQTRQLQGDVSSPPSSAPKTNGRTLSDTEANANANGLNALPLDTGVLENDNAAETENAEEKARLKAEKRARKEEKRAKKEEKRRNKEEKRQAKEAEG